MKNFIISGFADEISSDLATQIRVLKENKIKYLELRSIDGKNVSEFTFEEAKKYKNQLDKNDIRVSSIGSPIGKISIKDPFSPHLDLFKHVLEIARIFNAPYIRLFSFFIPKGENPDEYTDQVIERMHQFLILVRDYPEITLLHENEKDIYGDIPQRCAILFERLNNPQFQAAFDPANFVQCNVEVYPQAFDLLKDKITYLHIKDARYSDHKVTPAAMGDGQVANILKALVEKGFIGFASIEPHLSFFDGFLDLEKAETSIENYEGNGEKLFSVASEALKKILVEEMNQEWK